jgi:hypothetical protein
MKPTSAAVMMTGAAVEGMPLRCTLARTRPTASTATKTIRTMSCRELMRPYFAT